MINAVLCLRPQADFERAGALPPPALHVTYRSPGDDDVPSLVRAARALVIPAVGPALPASLFEGAALGLIQVTGAGLDRLDRPAIERLGIPVANVPGGSTRAVAEYAVTTASLLLRRFAWADAEIRRGGYVAFRARMVADNLRGLDGLTAGIVGLGTIGLAVAEAFLHMGCRICFYDPLPANPAAAVLGAESMSLDALLAASDVVSLHVPLLPATTRLIGDRELSLMKPGAVLIQASRGGVVDEDALATHLRRGHIGGAAVDVYASEPPAPDNPLLALADSDGAHRLILTPHIAGVTRQSSAFLFRSAWRNVERVLVGGEPPENRVF